MLSWFHFYVKLVQKENDIYDNFVDLDWIIIFESFFGYFTPSPLDVVYGKQGGVREDLTEDALRVEKIVYKIRQIHLQVQKTLNKSQETYKDGHDQHITEK